MMDSVILIDAHIGKLRAEIKLLQQRRMDLQRRCKHVYDKPYWVAPGCHEDPPEGDYFQKCIKCKSLKIVYPHGKPVR